MKKQENQQILHNMSQINCIETAQAGGDTAHKDLLLNATKY